MINIKYFMNSLEKILSDIVNNMKDDDMEKITSNKSIYNHHINKYNNQFSVDDQDNNNGHFHYKLNVKKNQSLNNKEIKNHISLNSNTENNTLDFILQTAILKWIETDSGKALLTKILTQIVNDKLSIPVDDITEKINEKISDKNIENMLRKILKSNL